MQAHVDEQGRLILPAEAVARYGLQPGAQVQLEAATGELRLRRPATSLAKLYIEPTSACNLNCRTCIRNDWGEPLGKMNWPTFERILAGLRGFPSPPTVFFGGFGEPLTHPRIVDMVTEAKALGCPVELITNGMLLTEPMSRRLIAAGLDRLWISLDGATPDCYADVRLGADLPDVIANIATFSRVRPPRRPRRPEIGIAFVAMRSNIAELPALLKLGSRLGAVHFMVTNLLPYTEEMRPEVLYDRAPTDVTYLPSPWMPNVNLPKMHFDAVTEQALLAALRSNWNITLAGTNLGATNDRCPFIEQGAAAIGWDGRFSPCLPLLHSHTSYLDRRARRTTAYSVGSLTEQELGELWHAPEHITFRERVQRWDFPPCTFCGGCELSFGNDEDCFRNPFPTCGGCLWAQGIVRCP